MPSLDIADFRKPRERPQRVVPWRIEPAMPPRGINLRLFAQEIVIKSALGAGAWFLGDWRWAGLE
jgi:hypothetical protein